jgi:hypothetical protein
LEFNARAMRAAMNGQNMITAVNISICFLRVRI